MDTKKILLVNDLAGYGKVALSVMFPILSSMKYELFNLPTALVSNTLNYGKFHILETTDYMRESISVWNSRYHNAKYDRSHISCRFMQR